MKIAIFSDVYLDVPGGIVSSINAQKEGLEKAGHEVVIFSPGFAGRKREPGVYVVPTCKVLRLNKAPVAHRPGIVEKWILKQFPDFGKEFDLVHVHYEAGCSIAGMRLAKKYGITLVQTMHGREDSALAVNIPHPFKTLVGTLLNWFHSWYLPHKITVRRDDYLATTIGRAKMWTMMVNHASYADLVLTPSYHLREKLRHYGVKTPMQVLSNGINDSLMQPEVQARILNPGDTIKILSNARISHEKRFMVFLEALTCLKIPYEVHAYGDGNELKKAMRYVKRHKLNVKFYGLQKREVILAKMMECHLSVLASYNFDNQPMTLLEAELAGLPVFICDPDMKEVVAEGGYLLANGPSAKQMAGALDYLYKHPEMVKKMSETMIAHRKEVLQSEKIKGLLQIYKAQ